MFEIETIANAGNAKMLRLARLPRLYRVVKVLRLIKIFRLVGKRKFQKLNKYMEFNHQIRKIAIILAKIFFLNHLMACFWFFEAKFTDFPDDCWVRQKEKMHEPPFT